jgi:hypothetical protein
VEQKDGFGVDFFGADGEVRVNRGEFVLILGGKTIASFTKAHRNKGEPAPDQDTTCGTEVHKAETLYLANARVKLYDSKNHISDFLACVKSRKKPITSEQIGARSAICCHLINQSYYHHAQLKWNPAKFKFTGGTGELAWLTRDYRAPWSV